MEILQIDKKVCIRCQLEKEITEFYISRKSRDQRDRYCKECKDEKYIEWRNNNKEKIKNYENTRYSKNKDKIRERVRQNLKSKNYEVKKRQGLLKNYGLKWEEYNKMLEDCKKKCQICEKDFDLLEEYVNKNKSQPQVDHCHITGKIRGLLCGKCNSILGYCNDNIEILKNTIIYLEKYSNEQ